MHAFAPPAAPLAVLALALHAGAQPASFQTVPAIPGGNLFSLAYAATPDGAYVVGVCGCPKVGFPPNRVTSAPQAYRWNRVTGELLGLGFLGTQDYFRSKAFAVSDDGGAVVGFSDIGDHSGHKPHAFRWSALSGMVALPFGPTTHPTGPQSSEATGISADGGTIVGYMRSYGVYFPNNPNYFAALKVDEWCVWPTTTACTMIPDNTTPQPGRPETISADGSLVLGLASDGFNTDLTHAGGFGPANAVVTLGALPGGRGRGEATAISRDNSTVVGWADTLDADNVVRYHAFRWRADSGMVDLGRLPGLRGHSKATGVSGDGSIVVGSQDGHALIWDGVHGLRDLASVLAGGPGLDLQGKVLTEATWISPDGHWIVGNADDPNGSYLTVGWIAYMP